jgi:hypothetical protein
MSKLEYAVNKNFIICYRLLSSETDFVTQKLEFDYIIINRSI